MLDVTLDRGPFTGLPNDLRAKLSAAGHLAVPLAAARAA
jgi:hypothetical protein